eukprot:CAMPEP_0194093434 /NCGR_PEP_ID=MMETSP0149-20130528/50416_1 /TAXON_ID=122233 /ORGANISM="Chaetoceros debilis, Strain MM31A-1" /LENGTH=1031 /DNA_ID=CAMNT_0038778749 /DNA_START=147 /DNA_END=3242 /DNA_ORIENTATION=+
MIMMMMVQLYASVLFTASVGVSSFSPTLTTFQNAGLHELRIPFLNRNLKKAKKIPKVFVLAAIVHDADDEESIESLWSLEDDEIDDDEDDDDDLLALLELNTPPSEPSEDETDDDEDLLTKFELSTPPLEPIEDEISDGVDDLLTKLKLDTPPSEPKIDIAKSEPIEKKHNTNNDNMKGDSVQIIDATTESGNETNIEGLGMITEVEPLKVSPTKVKEKPDDLMSSAANQTVGVGRYGYNMTTLQTVQYDTKKYFPLNQQIMYRIRLDYLQEYYDKHGDIDVQFRHTFTARDYDFDGADKGDANSYEISLGRWMHNIRQRHKKNPEKIFKDYREELDGMGMNWDGVGAGRRPGVFRKRCEELKEFVNNHGNDRVPLDHEVGFRSLGIWVERQRVLYKKMIIANSESSIEELGDQVSAKRIEMLRDAGFDFESLTKRYGIDQRLFDQEWNRMCGLFSEIEIRDGHLNVHQMMSKSKLEQGSGSLLCWVAEQRYLLKGSSLPGSSTALMTLFTPQRLKKLIELGFDFGVESEISLPNAWTDFAKYKFDCNGVLHNLQEICVESSKNKCEITWDDVISSENSDAQYLLLYAFQQRVRWEYRHKSIWNKATEIDWLLDREDLDLIEKLKTMDFDWYGSEAQISNAASEIRQEYEWWETFYDFERYRDVNGSFELDSGCMWYSEELVDWLDEQERDYQKLSERLHNDEIEEQLDVSELHYRALCAIGYDFQSIQNNERILLPISAGRKPAVIDLELNLDDELFELSNDLDLRELASSTGGKRVAKAEQLAWLVRYATLRRYYVEDGPGGLSNISSDDHSGQRLILWANNQRKQYAHYTNGMKSNMTKRRVFLLNQIDFDWKLQRPGGKEEWEKMKTELIIFKAKFGHCFVPVAHPLNVRLGQWINLQREIYKQARRENQNGIVLPGKPSKRKENELLKIGLDLTMDSLSYHSIAYETIWMCRLEELASFKKEFGHFNVSDHYESPYYDLGVWVREQRILNLRNKQGFSSHLDQRRIDDLKQLGFTWEIETPDETVA